MLLARICRAFLQRGPLAAALAIILLIAGAVAGIVQARRRLAWQRALKELLVARAAKMRGPSQGVTASRLEDQMADAVEAEIVANRAYNAAEDRVAAIKAHHDELTEASLEERSGKAGV